MRFRATHYRWFEYVVAGVLCSMGVLFFIIQLFDILPTKQPENHFPMLILSFFWSLGVSWLFYWLLKKPTEICVTETNKIILRGPVRTWILFPNQITEIECDYDSATIHYIQGKLHLFGNYKGFSQFLEWLGRTNPNVRVSGERSKNKDISSSK